MATIAITVEVDDIDFATAAVNCLDWEMETIHWFPDGGAEVRLVTTTAECSSVARMLATYWTEYADIAEAASGEAQS